MKEPFVDLVRGAWCKHWRLGGSLYFQEEEKGCVDGGVGESFENTAELEEPIEKTGEVKGPIEITGEAEEPIENTGEVVGAY